MTDEAEDTHSMGIYEEIIRWSEKRPLDDFLLRWRASWVAVSSVSAGSCTPQPSGRFASSPMTISTPNLELYDHVTTLSQVHDPSRAENPVVPTIDDLAAHVKVLDPLVKEIRKR